MTKDLEKNVRGLFVIGLWLGVVKFTGYNLVFHEWIAQELSIPTRLMSPDGPPLYFIRSDFVGGIAGIVPILATLILASVIWKHARQYGRIILMFSLMAFGYKMLTATDIWLRCPLALGRGEACAWQSFDEYLRNPEHTVFFIVCVILGVWIGPRRIEKQVREVGSPTAPVS